jgi:hypothetical protein
MKNILLFLLISFSIVSCKKDQVSERLARVFKVEATGTTYNIVITRRITGTSNENNLEQKTDYAGNYLYEFSPSAGQTIKVTLEGAGLDSYKISYKGQEQVSSTKKGEGITKDFVIVN